MNREYITSERFIHDDLLMRAGAAVRRLPFFWRRDGKIEPSALTWPAEPVRSSDGGMIEGVCALSLADVDREKRGALLRLMVERTKAYGVLFVEQKDGEVCASFETRHGSRVWKLPIRRHGDVVVLEEPVVTTDGEGLGVLWKSRG